MAEIKLTDEDPFEPTIKPSLPKDMALTIIAESLQRIADTLERSPITNAKLSLTAHKS